ncbi:MAG: cation:proton antiporter [Peptococcaceae bacterium]|jgi:CPA2 family monovalent cation:H+ antiporter-2|nr:cation:proton antiporter [Peptococcaceae bacterium]
METPLVLDIVIVFLAALAGGFLADRLKQSPIIGYIVGGILIGPYALGLINDMELVRDMSELGVILLMFTLGIEFSLKRLNKVRNVAIFGGILQILLTIALGVIAGVLLKFSLYEALFLGCALSASSTMIVLRTLNDQGEINSTQSQIMIGMLIVQDLAIVVMVSLLPAIYDMSAGNVMVILKPIIKTVIFVVLVMFLASKIMPKVLDRAAQSSSNEIFLLLALCLGIGIAALASAVGLSVSLGAFLAGLVISESEYAQEIMGKIMSFRDAFVVLFFVAVGMLVNLSSFTAHWQASLIVLAVIIFGKFLIVFVIVRAFKFHSRPAFYCGMGLLQTGEFSIVLAQIGMGANLISNSLNDIILSTAIVSILLTPILMKAAPKLYTAFSKSPVLSKFFPASALEVHLNEDEADQLSDHVILCGYGRVGRYIGKALRHLEIPFVVIEYDYSLIDKLSKAGIPVIYGDASNAIVMEHAHPERAILGIQTLPDIFGNQRSARIMRRINPDLLILSRAHSRWERDILYEEGVTQVVQPETEGSMQLIWQMMYALNLPYDKIESMMAMRVENDFQSYVNDRNPHQDRMNSLRIKEFKIEEGFPWLNKTLLESRIREETGCNIVSIRKDDGFMRVNPHSTEIIELGDQVVVLGTLAQLSLFANLPKKLESVENH